MNEDLLEILAEPGTRAPLRLEHAERRNGRIVSGELVAPSGRRFPIVRGIPRFVDAENYAASFGMQWNAFRPVQVDSSTGGTHSRARFDAETGWSRAMLEGRWTLDAGCGAGRFAEVAAQRGARLVALDISSAVEATAETLRPYERVDVVQASLLEPPFRQGVFDFAYSIGVLQHTPDPERGVREVVETVKRGGQFALTIYARQPWTRLNAKYVVRPLTKRLPPSVLLRGIQGAMPVLFPITEIVYRIPGIGRVARFAIPVANYVERREFDWRQRYAEAVLDTFDMLSPEYDAPMTSDEVARALRTIDARAWRFQRTVPIECRGER